MLTTMIATLVKKRSISDSVTLKTHLQRESSLANKSPEPVYVETLDEIRSIKGVHGGHQLGIRPEGHLLSDRVQQIPPGHCSILEKNARAGQLRPKDRVVAPAESRPIRPGGHPQMSDPETADEAAQRPLEAMR